MLIVDEASMLDLALATRLLEAVPPSARIILLGDKDQLAAVESGAVFAELCADPTLSDSCRRDLAALCALAPERIATPAPAQPSALRDAAVWLTRNYRFAAGSGIGRLAQDINQGRAQEAMAWLERGDDPSVQWLQPGKDASESMLAPVLAGYEPYLDAVRRDPTDVDAVTRAFNQFRTLCAVRQGPSGVTAVNDQVTRHARQALAAVNAPGHDSRSPWYVGRPVMVLRNDYVHKLFNGDIGIALPDARRRTRCVLPRRRPGLPRRADGAHARTRNRLRDDGAQGPGLGVRRRAGAAAAAAQPGGHEGAALHGCDAGQEQCHAFGQCRRAGSCHRIAVDPPFRIAASVCLSQPGVHP